MGREKALTGGTRSPMREWGRREEAGCIEENGPGRSCWAMRNGKRREEKKEGRGPGCAERERVSWASWAVREGEEKSWPRLGRKWKGK
jgi:hypothetical protein